MATVEDDDFGLPRKVVKDLREAFECFDTQKDGTITAGKLGHVMKHLVRSNPTEAEVQDLINAVDDDGNGTIEFEEFVAMMKPKLGQKDTADELKEAFRIFDYDENGFVDVTDLKVIISNLGLQMTDDEIQDVFESTDDSGTGQIGFREFCDLAVEPPLDPPVSIEPSPSPVVEKTLIVPKIEKYSDDDDDDNSSLSD